MGRSPGNKIVGQIYVENRETVPYELLPRDLVNAVVAMEAGERAG